MKTKNTKPTLPILSELLTRKGLNPTEWLRSSGIKTWDQLLTRCELLGVSPPDSQTWLENLVPVIVVKNALRKVSEEKQVDDDTEIVETRKQRTTDDVDATKRDVPQSTSDEQEAKKETRSKQR